MHEIVIRLNPSSKENQNFFSVYVLNQVLDFKNLLIAISEQVPSEISWWQIMENWWFEIIRIIDRTNETYYDN